MLSQMTSEGGSQNRGRLIDDPDPIKFCISACGLSRIHGEFRITGLRSCWLTFHGLLRLVGKTQLLSVVAAVARQENFWVISRISSQATHKHDID